MGCQFIVNSPFLASNENPVVDLGVIFAPNPPKAEPILFDAVSDATPRRFAFIITRCFKVDSLALKELNELKVHF